MALSRKLDALSDDQPCGDDLEYDPVFLQMETLARGKAEQQFGETIVAAEAPDWKSVTGLCDALLERTRDFRVLAYLTQGLISENGVTGAADAYQLVLAAAEQFWDTIHPRLDAEDDNDPTMRLNALGALSDPSKEGGGVPRASNALRASRWLSAKGAHCTVRQALACLTKTDAGSDDARFSQSELEKIIVIAAATDPSNHARVALEAIEELNAFISDKVGSHRATDFRPILSILKPLADFFDRVTGQATDQNLALSAATESTADGNQVSGANRVGIDLRSREDAVKMLERVCEFLERQEPSNPAPLLIRRAQRLVTMSFVDIMKDLAPEALGTIENIAGTNRNATE